jgi:NTP pyrophosphatase (non-canonical NTP hydrolase)
MRLADLYAHVKDEHGLPLVGEWTEAQLNDTHDTLHKRQPARAIEGLRRPNVINDVLDERERQHIKWGEQNVDAAVWLAILMEEVGEAAEVVLWLRGERRAVPEELREEMVQVAAVAVAMIEWIDRGMPHD